MWRNNYALRLHISRFTCYHPLFFLLWHIQFSLDTFSPIRLREYHLHNGGIHFKEQYILMFYLAIFGYSYGTLGPFDSLYITLY